MANHYELFDAGGEKKLERFGAVTLVRPAPAARESSRLDPSEWAAADAEFVRDGKRNGWRVKKAVPEPWICRSAGRDHTLALRPSGQVGLFPEQAPLREWVGATLRKAVFEGRGEPRVLDLFAYTGGSTMAAAAAGAVVTSVDAARGVVAWARRNAQSNSLADAPIRWIVEDASRFVAREIRRGATYEGIVLDPPSFGRGPRGERWKLEKDLPELLAGCVRLLSAAPLFFLISAHRETWTPRDLTAHVNHAFGGASKGQAEGELVLESSRGVRLRSGVFVRREFA